jgi:hypothetical protein
MRLDAMQSVYRTSVDCTRAQSLDLVRRMRQSVAGTSLFRIKFSATPPSGGLPTRGESRGRELPGRLQRMLVTKRDRADPVSCDVHVNY